MQPQKFNAYFKVHEAYLEQFREEGLVLRDTGEWPTLGDAIREAEEFIV